MNDLPLEMIQELTTFFKALVDAERLRIAGRLARQSLSAEQLAAQLEIKPATLARHLEKLAEAGLVRAEAKGATTRYTLRLEAARALAARLTAQPVVITPEAAGDYDRQVLTH